MGNNEHHRPLAMTSQCVHNDASVPSFLKTFDRRLHSQQSVVIGEGSMSDLLALASRYNFFSLRVTRVAGRIPKRDIPEFIVRHDAFDEIARPLRYTELVWLLDQGCLGVWSTVEGYAECVPATNLADATQLETALHILIAKNPRATILLHAEPDDEAALISYIDAIPYSPYFLPSNRVIVAVSACSPTGQDIRANVALNTVDSDWQRRVPLLLTLSGDDLWNLSAGVEPTLGHYDIGFDWIDSMVKQSLQIIGLGITATSEWVPGTARAPINDALVALAKDCSTFFSLRIFKLAYDGLLADDLETTDLYDVVEGHTNFSAIFHAGVEALPANDDSI